MKHSLLPVPQHVQVGNGSTALSMDWALDDRTPWPATVSRAGHLVFGKNLPSTGARRLRFEVGGTKPEGYELDVTAETIAVCATDERGILHAARTLTQLVDRGRLPFVHVRDWPAVPVRAVHFDTRYKDLAPTFSTLLAALRRCADLKINCVVFEYEDKFPFEKHSDIWSPLEGYTRDELREFLAVAKENLVEVVPVQQCLGHVEYVLRHERYRDLSELPSDYSMYCPTNPAAFQLFRELATDMMDLHADSRFFCIGGDETWLLGSCERCRSVDKAALYADYVVRACEFVHDQGRVPIVWGGDMLAKMPETLGKFPSYVRLGDWDYLSQGDDGFPNVQAFRDAGHEVWPITCTRMGVVTPDYRIHPGNIRAAARKAIEFGCEGVLTTSFGWQNSPFETSWYGFHHAAEACWTGTTGSAFDSRFARCFYGVDDQRLAKAHLQLSFYPQADHDGIGEGIRANDIVYNFGHIYQPFLSTESHLVPAHTKAAERAASQLLAGGRVRKNSDHAAYLITASHVLRHELRKLELFGQFQELLNNPEQQLDVERVRSVLKGMRALAKDLGELRAEVAKSLRRSNQATSVNRADLMRYVPEALRIDDYASQLELWLAIPGQRLQTPGEAKRLAATAK